ncbi:serine/threonine-protein kinase rio1 [Leptinotarsa decemlineata]|uniref:serine/threonine-protein kinase rio1 n=1 Tax=Leptinotarsa decemlineata TaxID=7539 RepID=UPI003D30A3A4
MWELTDDLLSDFTYMFRVNHKSLNKNEKHNKDKSDRATTEQVMDPGTRMILFRLLNKNVSEINGCISTGKEANVYHAVSDSGEDYAIKIFKTSILVFKDRDKYMSGDFRFRHGYRRSSTRNMIKTWAEKERRNLARMHSKGLNVPQPISLESHVLLMTFIGKKGWPAPKLKDVELSLSKARQAYRETVVMMWQMYNKCKMVHADFSEYNMLYHNGQIYIIDVSQSVEVDHPRALHFLRMDCKNITEFFEKKNVVTMSIKDLFDFITDSSITESNMEECLDAFAEKAAGNTETTSPEQVDEEVFLHAYIPQRLTEVIDFERDINQAKAGHSENLIYKTLVGLKSDLSGTVQRPEILNGNEENLDDQTEYDKKFESSSIIEQPEILEQSETKSEILNGKEENHDDQTEYDESESISIIEQPEILDEDSETEREYEDEDSETESKKENKFRNSARPKNETKEEKKARKQAVKEAKAEKRKTKVKKHVKKRIEKLRNRPRCSQILLDH